MKNSLIYPNPLILNRFLKTKEFSNFTNIANHPKPRKLLDRVRDSIRLKHYSIRTEQTYVDWIRRFILFHHKQHPLKLGAKEIKAFRKYLQLSISV